MSVKQETINMILSAKIKRLEYLVGREADVVVINEEWSKLDGLFNALKTERIEARRTEEADDPACPDYEGRKCINCGYCRTVWSVCPNGCDTSPLLKHRLRNALLEKIRQTNQKRTNDERG